MTPEKQRELARTFRDRHRSGPIVALPNAFDAASARVFARHDPAAIGTTSGGIAWSAGYPDGQRIGSQEMLDAVARIVRAVDIGVTADVEAGYGDRPEDAAATTAAVVAAGAIGLNLEDSGASRGLLDTDRAAAKVAAVRAVAEQEGIDLVVNARTDVFLAGADADEDERLTLAVERGNAYLDAGADCVFVPGAVAPQTIEALVGGLRGPLNVYALPGVPPVAELERLGVARVSIGGGPYQACLALLEEIANGFLSEGSYAPFLNRQLSFADTQSLLGEADSGQAA